MCAKEAVAVAVAVLSGSKCVTHILYLCVQGLVSAADKHQHVPARDVPEHKWHNVCVSLCVIVCFFG